MMWASNREECCELERTAAAVAAGRHVPLWRAAGHDDARGLADAVSVAGGCGAGVLARAGRGGAAQSGGALAVEPQAAVSAAGGQPTSVLGGRPGFRPRLPRAAFGSAQPGRRT